MYKKTKRIDVMTQEQGSSNVTTIT
ncbi:peptidylprolyl isomerase, partial [Vibrio parahaemolyticus]